jgi:hypothetical protein
VNCGVRARKRQDTMTSDRFFVLLLGIIVGGFGLVHLDDTVQTLKTTPILSSIGIVVSLALLAFGTVLTVRPGLIFPLFR